MKSATLASRTTEVVHLRTRSPVQGLHVLGEWYGCPRSEAIRRADRLRQVCVQLAREHGFEVLAQTFAQFQPQGVIGTMILGDAHFAIHTWPDTGFVAVDCYASHLTPRTRHRALDLLARLSEVMRPVWINTSEIKRGVADGT